MRDRPKKPAQFFSFFGRFALNFHGEQVKTKFKEMLRPIDFLTAKDIMLLLKCSQTTAYRKMHRIKKEMHKPPHGLITLHEFYSYYALQSSL